MPYGYAPYGYGPGDLRPLADGEEPLPDWSGFGGEFDPGYGLQPSSGYGGLTAEERAAEDARWAQNYGVSPWLQGPSIAPAALPVPAATDGGAPTLAAPGEWEEYYDPSKGQIWAKDNQGNFRYVREANPWERPGAADQGQGRPAAQAAATYQTPGASNVGVYNRGPLQDLLAAMQLQYQIWRDKLSGRANEKQNALQYALAYGEQRGFVMDPRWFLAFVEDEETKAGLPPEPAGIVSGYEGKG